MSAVYGKWERGGETRKEEGGKVYVFGGKAGRRKVEEKKRVEDWERLGKTNLGGIALAVNGVLGAPVVVFAPVYVHLIQRVTIAKWSSTDACKVTIFNSCDNYEDCVTNCRLRFKSVRLNRVNCDYAAVYIQRMLLVCHELYRYKLLKQHITRPNEIKKKII